MKPIIKHALSLLLSLVMAVSVATAAVPAAEFNGTGSSSAVINVSAEDIETLGPIEAIQNALDTARDNATESDPYTVVIPAGTYGLNTLLRIYDNTTLDMRGVTLVHESDTNIIKVGAKDTNEEGPEGYCYQNIHLVGGVLDGNQGSNTLIKVFHAKNFTMDGVTLCNDLNAHMMEVAGVDGMTIRNCTFRDQILEKGNFGYEALQLDVLYPFHIYEAHAEALSMKNVLIEGCTFDNVPRGIGSHTNILNNPHSGITIRNNSFTNIKSIAIQGMGWSNTNITNNYIDNAPRGITVYSVMYRGNGTYLASDFYKIGHVESDKNISEKYIAPVNSNINICYNELHNIGTLDDIYASYESHGIAVLGTNLTALYPKNTSDSSAGLPVGEYYNDTVNIRDNYIDVRGHGIRVEYGRNVVIKGNELIHTKNTVHASASGYMGMLLRYNSKFTAVNNNTIIKPETDGIQLRSSTASSVSNNYIENTGKYGICSYTCTLGNVNNNDVNTTANQGICLMESTKATAVRNNRVKKTGKHGIYFTANTSAADVSGNTTLSCANNLTYYKSYNLVKAGTNYTKSATLEKFSLEKEGVIMGVGTAFMLVPEVYPVNAFSTFTYKSGNTDIVTVDKYGRIKAVGTGSTTVKVTANTGGSKSYPVTVDNSGTVKIIDTQSIATPAISSLTAVTNGIKLKWSAVSGAKGYRIYRLDGAGWVGLGNVTTTEYTDTNVAFGNTYTYTLRCLDGNHNPISDYNHTGWKIAYGLSTPKITSAVSAANGVVVSWGKVPGAFAYRVYCKNATGWTNLGTVTTTSFTDTKIKSGETRTYTVRCVDNKGVFTSDFDRTGVKGSRPAAPKVNSISSSIDGVLLKWNAISGVYGYRIFKKNSAGSWVRLGTTTANTFTDTTAVSGTTYIYTVRCIDKNDSYISDFNHTGFKITYIAAPIVSNIVVVNNGVTLSWSAVKGASSYRVFYMNASGDWIRLAKVTGTSYTDTAIKQGETRVYTVRCMNAKESYISDFVHDGFTATRYATPDFTLTNEATGVRISWTPDSNIDRYRVYLHNGKSWTALDTVYGDSYLDENVRAGGAYTYTVRGIGANGYPDSFATGHQSPGKKITYQPAVIPTGTDVTEDLIPEETTES